MNAGTYLAASRYAMPYHARPREMECIDYRELISRFTNFYHLSLHSATSYEIGE